MNSRDFRALYLSGKVIGSLLLYPTVPPAELPTCDLRLGRRPAPCSARLCFASIVFAPSGMLLHDSCTATVYYRATAPAKLQGRARQHSARRERPAPAAQTAPTPLALDGQGGQGYRDGHGQGGRGVRARPRATEAGVLAIPEASPRPGSSGARRHARGLDRTDGLLLRGAAGPALPAFFLALLRARTLCNPPHLQRLPRPRAPCPPHPAAAACPVTRACSMPAPCSRPLRPSRPRAFTPAAARRTGLLPHVGLPAGEGGHDRAPSPSP